MKVGAIQEGKEFTAMLHYAIENNEGELICLAMAGINMAVTAITASCISGDRIELDYGDGNYRLLFPTRTSSYRRILKKTPGESTYACLLAKQFLINKEIEITKDDEEETPESFLVRAEHGDIDHSIAIAIAHKYSLPITPEFLDLYKKLYVYNTSFYQEHSEPVKIIKNPLVQKYKDLKAVLLKNMTESKIVDILDIALKAGAIEYGQGQGTFDPEWTEMKQYLSVNAPIMADALDSLTPYHDMQQLDPVIATLGRIPLPAQAHAAQAIYNRLASGARYAFSNGDPGSGKSITATCLIKMLAKNKPVSVLITAPATVVPKWVSKEIKPDLPMANIRVLNSTEDALQFRKEIKAGYKPKKIDITLVSIDRVKLGPNSWACAALWKNQYIKSEEGRLENIGKPVWHCPECFEPLKDPEYEPQFEGDYALATWDIMAEGAPGTFPAKWRQKSPLKKCHKCGSYLWRPATKPAGDLDAKKPRWSIARILKKDFRRYFDLYISDEIHEQKAANSGRGDALGQLVRSAQKIVGLTATFTNGASTSVKEILWRIAPYALLEKGFNRDTGMIQWASNYGVLEKIVKIPIGDTGIVTRKRSPRVQVREKPGINPIMPVDYLLGSCVFLELPDLGIPLVERKEIPMFITMDDEHQHEYQQFHQKLLETCKKRGNFGPFIPGTINYGDRPDLGGYAAFKYIHNGTLMEDIVEAPKISGFNAKERALVDLVKQELSENRGVCIYVSYTDKYQMHSRVKHVLKQHGIEAEILPTSVSPDRRVEWLRKKEEIGTKVIISNVRLVSTGIDLLPWPTLIFYQLDYNVNTVRQAAGRAWRIGQFRECRIYYMIMDGTQQVSQLERVMARRGHAMLTEGKLDKSELAKYSRDANTALAADIANCIADQNLSKAWKELAAKDVVDVEMVAESEYEETIRIAMLNLANETKRLCGVTDDDSTDIEIKTWTPGNIEITVVKKAVKKGRRVLATEGQQEMFANIA